MWWTSVGVLEMLFQSGECGALCFSHIYDVALGACDGVDDVVVLYCELL